MKHNSPDWYVLAVNDLHIGPDVYRVAVVAEMVGSAVTAIRTYLLQVDREGGAFGEVPGTVYRIMYYVEDGVERLHLVVYDCLVESITYN